MVKLHFSCFMCVGKLQKMLWIGIILGFLKLWGMFYHSLFFIMTRIMLQALAFAYLSFLILSESVCSVVIYTYNIDSLVEIALYNEKLTLYVTHLKDFFLILSACLTLAVGVSHCIVVTKPFMAHYVSSGKFVYCTIVLISSFSYTITLPHFFNYDIVYVPYGKEMLEFTNEKGPLAEA